MENKRIEYDNIIYCIKEEEAYIVGIKGNPIDIYIPLSIKYEWKEYDITTIFDNAFTGSCIKFIHFAPDSKLQTIGNNSFSWSSIKSIQIPPSVTLIGKSAFYHCEQLQQIEIPKDSQLQTIDKEAFSLSSIKSIQIPPSVTMIGEDAFYRCEKLQQIEIPNDSKLQTIGKYAFFKTEIKSIMIPSELIELKEGWCYGTRRLTNIKVSPTNPRYCCFNEKMIIGKMNIEENDYNCLVFCVRDIQYVNIPNFIEHICSYSFYYCKDIMFINFSDDSRLQTIDEYAFFKSRIKSILIPPSVTIIEQGAFYCCEQLKQVEFHKNSKLQTISKSAFSWTKIEWIQIPSSVTLIGENAFENCYKLKFINIPNDSKLRTIEKNAFSESEIKSITIPSKLIELKEGWCNRTRNLTVIKVSPDNPRYCCYEDKLIIGKTNIEENNYDCLVFCTRDIQHISIPNFIEHIGSYSFDNCEQLESIEISNDSKLKTIEKNAFYWSSIKSIKIPSSVTLIGKNAFYNRSLELIEIPNDSKLRTIEKGAFSETKIKSIRIPSELIELKDEWCIYMYYLTEIEISPDNPRYCCYEDKLIICKTNIEENNYDCLVFCARDIQHINIPNFIEHICSCSFQYCTKLESIEIPNDSKLQTIDNYAFSRSTIKSIRIPSSVTLIGEYAFYSCYKLESIEIPNDSKLQTIDKNAFSQSTIESIRIPSSVTSIGGYAFFGCSKLKIIEIDTEMSMCMIEAFKDCKNSFLMVPNH